MKYDIIRSTKQRGAFLYMLYIPETLKVGFQNREDTFDGKLSYIIYFDEKGKLRKESSWNSWCHKDIESIELKNEIFKNPTLNKSVQRYGYHFGSGRNMLRIYDPRGFEYEISISNFVGISQYCDMVKGELVGEFVYAFQDGDIILLPVESEQYKEAKQDTLNKNTKVSAKDLKPGNIYTANNGNTCIYIGKYNINKDVNKYYHLPIDSSGKKHIFYIEEEGIFKDIGVATLGLLIDTLEQEDLNRYLDVFVGSNLEKEVDYIYIDKNFDIDKIYKEKNFCDFLFAFESEDQHFNKLNINTPNIFKNTDDKYYVRNDNLNIYYTYLSLEDGKYKISGGSSLYSYWHNDVPCYEEGGISKDSEIDKIMRAGHYSDKKTVYSHSEEELKNQLLEKYKMIFEEWKKNGVGIIKYKFKDGSESALFQKVYQFDI